MESRVNEINRNRMKKKYLPYSTSNIRPPEVSRSLAHKRSSVLSVILAGWTWNINFCIVSFCLSSSISSWATSKSNSRKIPLIPAANDWDTFPYSYLLYTLIKSRTRIPHSHIGRRRFIWDATDLSTSSISRTRDRSLVVG